MWLLLKNLLFTVLMPGTVGVYLPLWIAGASRAEFAWPWTVWRLIAIGPIVLGAALYFSCLWQFGARGRGTPAPIDPPKRLVIWGPYRYVRNPMYVGVFLVVLGWTLFFRSTDLLWYAAAVALAFNVFIFVVEEPVLRRKFGNEYAAYCRAVRRWWPGRPFAPGA